MSTNVTTPQQNVTINLLKNYKLETVLDKRYQVFVSSTYADLKDERQKVIQALMEMDCIPAGMELFPAADDEQWNFIQRVIDDCDYYIPVSYTHLTLPTIYSV